MNDKTMNTYKRTGLVLEHGKGATLYTKEGAEYIDFTAGIGVNSLGHGHPKLVKAIADQAARLIHVSNYFMTDVSARLSERLADMAGMDKVFFCNSGAEANEGLIKIARKYGSSKKADKNVIVTLKGSFHGRTVTTVTATGQDKFHQFFGPFTPGFVYVEANNIAALDAALTENVCAFLFEPIQGEGGVNPLDTDYLKAAEALCRKRDILFVADEVQTGIGRTGKLFAYEHSGIEPDIMTLAKALGNGFPIGAMLTTNKVAKAFTPGNHASTFGGNPLAMSAAQAALTVILQEGVLDNCCKMGEYFSGQLKKLQGKHKIIKEVRGRGLMLACSLNVEGAEIVTECMKRGVLINCTGGKTLRFVPPLIITKSDIDQVISMLDEVMEGK